MICINHKKNQKLLQTFNNDPYSDITIRTASNELHLVLGYLSIDSLYFDEVAPDTNQINLEHLSEPPLIKILRALYGEQLFAYNVNELKELYTIIEFLRIAEYKQNIIKYIIAHPQLMDSFELIQFCFSRHILQEQIRTHHYDLKLSVLASTKNYLQLNKLSQNTLNSLLIQYSQLKGEEADQTINSIIENYLGRTDLRPNQYFMQPGLQPLLAIWEKFHHSISYLITAQQKVRQSQIMGSQQIKKSMLNNNQFGTTYPYSLTNLTSSPSIAMGTSIGLGNTQAIKLTTQTSVTTFSTQLQEKQNRIKELQTQLALKKQIVESLKIQIANAKRDPMFKKSNKLIESEQEALQEAKNLKREKQLNQGKKDYDVSLLEPALDQARRVASEQGKDLKTINKLNSKGRRIFN